MEDDDSGIDSFEPDWLNTGGIPGIDPAYPPFTEDNVQWDTQAYTQMDQPSDDFAPPGSGSSCMQAAGDPPGSGTWFLGSIDGVCQWIDSTTCP